MSAESSYLDWLARSTGTSWWHDSADPVEIEEALSRGATGVTTNPVPAAVTLAAARRWDEGGVPPVASAGMAPEQVAEALLRQVVTQATERLGPVFADTGGRQGYVCAQVNPFKAGDREAMLAMARRFASWAPNIAVKLPVTAAGLDVLEECVAGGITVAATVSFTVPQVVAVAERHRLGARRAGAARRRAGSCFAVIMIGRLDDYLREVAADCASGIDEADIRLSGLAVAKRAYSIYRRERYEAVLLVAALRAGHHATELAGAQLVLSISPGIQRLLIGSEPPREAAIDREVPPEAIGRLLRLPEFRKAYEPEGMKPAEFVSYGATQRTLSQFCEMGWRRLESWRGP